MKFKNLFIATICYFILLPTLSSQEEDKKFGINFGGFVKNDVFYDTRQTISAREGHFLILPTNELLDAKGADINATPNFNMLAIQTRLTGKITGPDAFGAKTSGIIEGEFFGTSNNDISGFRVRHAFVKFNWNNSELLAGQTWNPMFIAQAFPEVISFNTGVPFQPFARNPQLRYTYKKNNLSLIATAYTLRDFPTTGPAGAITTIQRNAGMPNANFTFTFSPSESKNIFGAGINYKTIIPEIKTLLNHKTNTSLSSVSVNAFSKLVFNKITWKLQGVYAQNSFDIMGIGGYAVMLDTYDTITGIREYTNLNTANIWTEVYYSADKFVVGVFGGYSKNMGSSDKMDTGNIFARGANIEYMYRVSPRIAFTQNKTTIGIELEYTSAAYADANDINEMGEFVNSKEIANVRALLSFIYKF